MIRISSDVIRSFAKRGGFEAPGSHWDKKYCTAELGWQVESARWLSIAGYQPAKVTRFTLSREF